MGEHLWKVVPLCERQLRDISPEDILNGGIYRRCNIYKGGGGYDKFSDIYIKRNGLDGKKHNNQFVVQLYGCPLKCPYCYVTDDGVFGKCKNITTKKLLEDFYKSRLNVFHLMGGAPAIYIEHWADILKNLDEKYVFHSDFLLAEKEYDKEILKDLSKYKTSLCAVGIKGGTEEEFKRNTNSEFRRDLFWGNLENLWKYKIRFYLTFAGMNKESIECFKRKLKKKFPNDYEKMLEDSFQINIIKYKALD